MEVHAMAGFFTALALLASIIPFIVTEVKGWAQGAERARELLAVFGFSIFGLGTLLTIIVAMGSLANERASGTAAMTLSKPVTRSAFVATKFLGLVASIFASLAIASAVMYILTLILFDNGGLARFAGFMAIIGVYLVFIGSIAFFWSGMFRRQLLAGGGGAGAIPVHRTGRPERHSSHGPVLASKHRRVGSRRHGHG